MKPTASLLYATLFSLACSGALAADAVLETVAELDYAPGNIAVARDGTVIISLHSSMSPPFIGQIIRSGDVQTFPPGEWSTILRADDSEAPGLLPVLGIRADSNDKVWMLSGGGGQPTKHIYVWDLATNTLERDMPFSAGPGVANGSFFNDLALAPRHGKIFISDPARNDNAAIVVVDVASGTATRKLEGHSSVITEAVDAYIDGKPLGALRPDGEVMPLRTAINPITIDANEEWLYYGAMSGLAIYRVRVDDLLDDSLDAAALGARVERYADKPICAGITVDDAGNVYVTDIQANGIGVAAPGQPYRLLVQDDTRLSWPDGIGIGPDNYVYVASNSLFRNMATHRDAGPPQAPFYITRFKTLAPATPGR